MNVGDKIKVVKATGMLKEGMVGECAIVPTKSFTGSGIFGDVSIGIGIDNCIVVDSGSKYKRSVSSLTIDIYDVLQAWQVTNPAIQHAIKKLLQPGQRGHKTRTEDLQEALVSIERAIELERV